MKMMQVEGRKLVIDEIVICCSNSFRAMSIEGEETWGWQDFPASCSAKSGFY